MTKVKHGKVRYYFRRSRGTRVPLAGELGSVEFLAAYQNALNNGSMKVGVACRGGKGTFDHLVKDYFASPDFLRLGLASGIAKFTK